MQVSQAGIDLIKSNEGCKLRSYLCPAGVWTIGYGHTGPEVTKNMVITQAEADQFLATDLAIFSMGVDQACNPVTPTQNEFDAFVSFSYNIGLEAFKNSTVLKAFKAGDKVAAANAFMLWIKAKDPKTGQKVVLPGLVKRRTEEKQLFLVDSSGGTVDRPVSPDKTTDVPESSVVPVSPPRPSLSKEVIGGMIVGMGSIGQLAGNLTADDLQQAKTGTQTLQQDARGSAFFTHIHMPEIAAGMTVVLSMFIIWKRFSDRTKGIR